MKAQRSRFRLISLLLLGVFVLAVVLCAGKIGLVSFDRSDPPPDGPSADPSSLPEEVPADPPVESPAPSVTPLTLYDTNGL